MANNIIFFLFGQTADNVSAEPLYIANIIAIIMNEKGFGVMSIKREVIVEIRERAKEEKTTLSDLLSGLLQQSYSNKDKKECSNNIATRIKEYSNSVATEIKELKEAVYSNRIATGKVALGGGITKQDLDNSLLGLESDLDMKMREMLKEVTDKM